MKSILTAFCLALITTTAFSKELKIKFRVMDYANNSIKGATVSVYNGNNLDTLFVADASVNLHLEFNKYYTLEISLDGFTTKRVIINSKMEEGAKKERYSFEVELLREAKYQRIKNAEDFLDYPIAIVEYDPVLKDFSYNETYMKSSLEQFEGLRKKDIKF